MKLEMLKQAFRGYPASPHGAWLWDAFLSPESWGTQQP